MGDKIYLEPHEAPSIQIMGQGKEVFRIKANGDPMLGPDATVDDAAKALVDAIGNGMHKYISEIKAENERLREALQNCIYVLGNDGAIEGSLRVTEIATAALQQKESE